MQRVIHNSILITLEVTPAGVSKCTTEQSTAALTSAWLQAVAQQIVQHITTPTLEIYVRWLPLSQGAHVQILLCWIVLQAHRLPISDFDEPI